MLVTKITTHVLTALGRLLQQYKGLSPICTVTLHDSSTIDTSRLGTLIASLVDQIQVLENAVFDIDEGRQLYNGSTSPAIGEQLDGIGELVGIQRNGMLDGEYLIFILGTIAEEFSKSTVSSLINIAALLFQVNTLIATEIFPAEVDFGIPATSPLQSTYYNTAANILQNAAGADVTVGLIALYPSNPLRLSYVGGPLIGGGLANTNNPGTGGELSTGIYFGV